MNVVVQHNYKYIHITSISIVMYKANPYTHTYTYM